MMKPNDINETAVVTTNIQQVLAFIEQKKQAFAQEPFFKFFLNHIIDPAQRLSFAPCVAPLVMGFAELNRSVLRDEPTDNPIQMLINQHTYEDDHHWQWYLSDLQKLGMNRPLQFSDTVKFLWGDETWVSRWVIYELYRYTCQATPIQNLMMIEAIEATSNVFFSAAAQVGQELQTLTEQQYYYFAHTHFAADSEHSLYSTESQRVIETTQLSEADLANALERVEKTFEIFTALTHAFLAYAQRHEAHLVPRTFFES